LADGSRVVSVSLRRVAGSDVYTFRLLNGAQVVNVTATLKSGAQRAAKREAVSAFVRDLSRTSQNVDLTPVDSL
jgi:hypothetical protein